MNQIIDSKLFLLTGLKPLELAEVLDQNPRAYMALKGAVAEKHLEQYLRTMVESGHISSFRSGSGDFEKDFYIKVNGEGREYALECKNVEVIKNSTKKAIRSYLRFLRDFDVVDDKIPTDGELDNMSRAELDVIHNQLPSHIRESGLERYKFSEHVCGLSDVALVELKAKEYLSCFSEYPISIDFQRTRNSQDTEDGDSKKQRKYRSDEIDLVGACLFSRTLKWEFVFTHALNLPRHDKYPDRYTNNLKINPSLWQKDLEICLSEYLTKIAA
jgi:hypothetical protein